ncbi:3-oxoadipate enol-lactonase (plasmid) [Acinetobacter sp. NCu2D-2]|uniref:3-oxoadipate enol-lactonase n=1 Tax=Acinetobacter sp. NCu2D-2 TaxID=1608473 RepID=UPI0007CDF093|nr:3-oxoadipate enol-lactonase [Acinetobacter sp. NCu2D-2]ANF83370.1 3-oxoadipate enol-lactonase [Acinetobacter sp. NCu2D-2]
MPTFTSNTAQINFQTFGDQSNPAIIFSNSLGTNYSMWQPQIEFFKSNYFIICYDTRGHGKSTAPQGPYNLELLGEDVINLLNHLEISKAIFCGISMGGITGQWLAQHYPDRFNYVIVCNTAAKIGSENTWLDRANLVREQGLLPIASTAAGRWFTDPFIQSNPTIVAKLSNDLGAGSPEGYASCCEALAKADVREDLSKIRIPVLIIAGQQDPVTTVEDGLYMQHNIPGSQLFEINASHISNLEKADDFNRAIQKFIV